MAKVMLVRAESRREWFVVDAPVGLHCKNREDDVLLVQFLLRVASESTATSPSFKPPKEDPIVIDGRFTRQTHAYISFYQEEVNRRVKRKVLQPDGRIDPTGRGITISTISHTVYTILDLNVAYKTRRGDNARVETDPLFPKQLAGSFFFG